MITDLAPDARPACADTDPEEYFRSRGLPQDRAALRRTARNTCGQCPLIAACGAQADRDRLVGLWGGSVRRGYEDYTRVPLIAEAPLPPLPALIPRALGRPRKYEVRG